MWPRRADFLVLQGPQDVIGRLGGRSAVSDLLTQGLQLGDPAASGRIDGEHWTTWAATWADLSSQVRYSGNKTRSASGCDGS
jgi:hypothetical protein